MHLLQNFNHVQFHHYSPSRKLLTNMASIAAETLSTVRVTADMIENQHTEEEDAAEYLQGWALTSLTLGFTSTAFVLALDNTILATAIPQITSDFQSLNDMGWYGSSYLIAQMAMLPTCGRLYTFYNIKWTYCIMLAVFELGCIIAAVAPNSTALIVGRAVSGLGAAGLLSGAAIVMSYCVALKTRPMVLAIVLGMYSIGSAVGPLVGGAITDNKTLTWRFIFWVNLPFGAVALLYYSSSHFPKPYSSVKNTSARDSGIYSLPIIVSNSLGTLSAGWIASRSRHYVPLMWIGAPILAAGGGLYQLIGPASPAAQLIGFQILSGVGYGICGQMPILAVQVVLGEADVPTGLVMVMLFQCLGGALAPSVGQNLFTDKLLRNLGEVQGIDGAAVVAAGGREFREIVPPELIDEVIDAFSSALRNVFWVALATPVLAWTVSWAMEWRRLPQDRGKAATANATTQALTTQNLEK
ncbi:hypothetical protein DL765_007921 [Monosporascus sp. GIB2]|nr:hypothetical protein DL765_007921 [Monosporascus sp. GIB2]